MSDFAEEVKRSSSKWIKTKDSCYRAFAWQRGYAVFSVSKSRLADTETYIDNQAEHHKKTTFREEYLQWLQAYGVEYDEQYVFSD